MKQIKDYTLIKLIGKGSFGETYLTQKTNTSYLIATKVINKKKMEASSTKKYLENEINILKELEHPNIVKFYELFQTNSNYYIMMEYCNGGELSKCLKLYKSVYKETFNIEIVQYLMRQIIDAFCYIHSKKIIHRDVKLDNILLSFDNGNDKTNLNMMAGKIKIIDFGLATKLSYTNLTYTALGSPVNMEPLILKKFIKAGGYNELLGYNEKADIWSLGTIFYELLTGELLFQVNNMKELMKKVEEGNYTIPLNKNFYKESISFLNCMLQYNPDDRLSINELAQHDFIIKNVNQFTQANINQLFNKIDRKKRLVINTKDNKTIKNVFNCNSSNEIKKINPYFNNNNKNKNNNNRYIRGRLNSDGEYSHNADIYSFMRESESNNNNNKRNSGGVIKIPININKQKNNCHRFTEGFVSPIKINDKNYELIKLEEEIRDKEKIEREEYNKKIMERQKQEMIERQKRENDKIKNWDKGREEIKRYINGLLNEYKSVEEYFNKNGLKNQEEDANNKLIQIQNNINKLEQGYTIYYDDLPKPINPEYIYNCPTNTRNNIFKDVLNKYREEKKELETNFKNEILKLQKLDNKAFSAIKGSVMPKLEKDKLKVDKLKMIIEGLQDRYNNKWTPPPLISKEFNTGNNKKISKDENLYQLVIHAGKTNYNSSNLVLKISMKINNSKTFSGDINILNYGDFEEDIIWNLTKNEMMDISKYFILVKYYSNKLYQGSSKININKLENESEINEVFPILLPNESTKTIINLNIKLKNPDNKGNNSPNNKEIINVKKIYPPFNGKCSETNDIPNIFINNINNISQ